jgi:hypothetical protein
MITEDSLEYRAIQAKDETAILKESKKRSLYQLILSLLKLKMADIILQ